MMKRALIILAALLVTAGQVQAAGDAELMESSGVNVFDAAARQSGAKWFINYCLSCHSANYMRYNRLAEDFGLSSDQVRENFIFDNRRMGSAMTIAMDKEDAGVWFGQEPPDLSLIGRSRGADWIYAYLRTFYVDDSGNWNNLMLPNLSMPHVLWELQGIQKAVFHTVTDENGNETPQFDHFEVVQAGSMSAEEYDTVARELATFFEYLGDPAKLKRKTIGWKVIIFLVLLTYLAYLLKVEYWRDVEK
jgi:ubiquinol-cytochrome c reductase cytochrome c1 subunit